MRWPPDVKTPPGLGAALESNFDDNHAKLTAGGVGPQGARGQVGRVSSIVGEYLATVPPKSRLVVARALDGTASPRQAIKAACLVCSHFDRAEISDCRVWRCPLHPLRPFRAVGPRVSEPQTGAGHSGEVLP